MSHELSIGFEKDLGTLLVGVDTLWGGNVKGSAAERFILDNWVSGKALPEIYDDPLAQELRAREGVLGNVDTETVRTFVRKYNLRDLPDAVRGSVTSFEYFRQRFVENLVGALEVMLHTALGKQGLRSLPSFDERRRATTQESNINLVPVEPLQEQLRLALNKAGVDSTEKNTRDRYLAWKRERVIAPEKVGEEVQHIKDELFERLKTRFLTRYHDTFNDYSQLDDLTLQGHTFQTTKDKGYTGFTQYDGGEDEQGRPLLKGLFEFNVDHPVTREKLYHLTAHEVIAHYFSCVMRDLSYRSGWQGIETTMGTMCSPEVALEEGLAETMLYLLYGSRERTIKELGLGMGIELAANDLENAAKYNVGILHLREGRSIDEVKAYVAEQCLLDDALVDKMSRVWAQHPIFSPMYGPAYHYGAQVVQAAASHLSPEKVLRLGLHLDGLLDIDTFGEKVKKALI